MQELEYPFNAEWIIKKKKSIKKQLLADKSKNFVKKKVAILGGQTTNDIKLVLELFLLNQGIAPEFYESEFNQYYEDGMFPNSELKKFQPDVIYLCTCNRNICHYPDFADDAEQVEQKLAMEANKFIGLWDHLFDEYRCPIIQNNFEYPFFRLMGNMDASDIHGRVNFVTRLNQKFYEYAQEHINFHICDVNYISSSYGLEKWAAPYYWHMYKYSMAVPAIPYLSFNVANIIKSIYGKNKKAFNLDLDNTLWGGVVGDDGSENIEIGQETSLAQTYSEFQQYLKLHTQFGVLLTVNSKNDLENALGGLKRPDTILKPEDFVSIKANWLPKDGNLLETAKELALLPDSFVFVDDNPVEREIIRSQVPVAAVPEIGNVEDYIQILDKSGFFEMTSLSQDDLKRNEMYQENAKRTAMQSSFSSYEDYLKSLEMEGEIKAFVPMYMSRIAQLTNKSNQFNLTTKRYSQNEIEEIAANQDYITLYGKLKDKFGDNGVVSVVIGKIDGAQKQELHLALWIMSCRVLKRDMEFAMMDMLIEKAKEHGITTIFGYYYPTEKNGMVRDFYRTQGFEKITEDQEGNTVWKFSIPENYQLKQTVIHVIGEDCGN